MTTVLINGVPYTPATTSSSTTIGVAISTLNRPDTLTKALDHHGKHRIPGAHYVVVDDGSTTPPTVPDWVTLVTHPQRQGVATTKNRCLADLMAAGCQHLFLFDDDAWPIADNWHRPYIDSPEPHLFAVFTSATRKSSTILRVYQDDQLAAYHATRGYALYYERRTIERVGGFDTRFQFGFEHVELSDRIHAAGLTAFPYQDVPNSDKLIYSADSKTEVQSVIGERDRLNGEKTGRPLLDACRGRTDYVPYTPRRNAVLTCLFAGRPDPQRRNPLRPEPQLAAKLLNSLPRVDVVVFHDGIDTTDPRYVKVPVGANPYVQRWITYRRYLLTHPDVDHAWCVDATDVECLQPQRLWDMQPDILYTGYEPTVCGCDWMRRNHPASFDWINANANKPLINAGVIGGHRDTLLTFTDKVITKWVEGQVEKKPEDTAGDMGYLNHAAYEMPNLETGPHIVTLFKHDERNTHSLFKHK